MKVLFYNAKTALGSTLIDKGISLIERCPHSHVEIVIAESATSWRVVGCHYERGGVTFATIPKSADWTEIEFDAATGWRARAIGAVGLRYALLGLLKTKWAWVPKLSSGFVCSTFLAWVLGLAKHDLYGMRDILLHCLERRFQTVEAAAE